MSLSTQVTGRYSSQRMKNLTNPDNPAASAVDSARLNYACADVVGDFITYAGIDYDDTDAQHVSVGVEGVIALLTVRMGTKGGDTLVEAYRKRLEQLRLTTSGDRIDPGTNTMLTPTNPGDDGTIVRPPFDVDNFRGVQVDPPDQGVTSSDIGD